MPVKHGGRNGGLTTGNQPQSWDMIIRFLLGLISIGIISLVGVSINLQIRVSQIEAGRFTSKDAYDMEARLQSALSDIRIRMQLPPETSKARMDEIEHRMTKVELHIARVSQYNPESE